MSYYICPVCGIADENAYLRCFRPDCTDGRDPRPQISSNAIRTAVEQEIAAYFVGEADGIARGIEAAGPNVDPEHLNAAADTAEHWRSAAAAIASGKYRKPAL